MRSFFALHDPELMRSEGEFLFPAVDHGGDGAAGDAVRIEKIDLGRVGREADCPDILLLARHRGDRDRLFHFSGEFVQQIFVEERSVRFARILLAEQQHDPAFAARLPYRVRLAGDGGEYFDAVAEFGGGDLLFPENSAFEAAERGGRPVCRSLQ